VSARAERLKRLSSGEAINIKREERDFPKNREI